MDVTKQQLTEVSVANVIGSLGWDPSFGLVKRDHGIGAYIHLTESLDVWQGGG